MFQELFAISKTIGCSVENSELRVVHNSLILDAVKDGEVSYLKEVLSALEEKYKERKSRVKQFACWVVSKLRSCAKQRKRMKIQSKQRRRKRKFSWRSRN